MTFIDDLTISDATYLSMTLLDSVAILSLIKDTIVESIHSLSVFFPSIEVACILTRRFLQDSFVCEVSLCIELAIVAILVFFTGLRPPFEFSALPHSVEICPFESIAV